MPNLINEIVTGIVESAMKELLGKSHGRTSTKRKKRQTRSATSGRFVRKTTARTAKPAKKQVSRRRTTASRSSQRSR
ncbi:hypothetical protein [Neorhizobium petrolearium]|uniref:Uncharacterized protein n=1 Tax=Neorhizobium petrolearium TaxID=515361 RepID=A0ABY8M8B9_9HYPH|nr:hypothetical protein [Neorhizobium petrolearium]MCC2610061.1 hypothetical protein [Neorhizobium petrolearium]WGI70236.1 hypothetical protein QEO92_09415 [Neorhizobium petrolearium]